ncbi:MAG: Spermidine/putrescine import ATP-binding protein PotA [Firmicutes bacterium]|nr:Spermidine/putrescine import ATP-binding protein PotA [Bacillota bacterium]
MNMHCLLPIRDLHPGYVTLSGIQKKFGAIDAVHNVDLNIARGEFFSLLGPSGCGKTTTLRLLAGLEDLDGGEIKIDGQTVALAGKNVPPEKRGVGIVFQDYALFPHLSVFANVAFGLYGMGKADIKLRVEQMLDLVGLQSSAQKYPHELSGGQRQRVALARTLAPCPSVVLLDEPFSNLDAELRDALRQETKEILRASGSTVILVTHDQEEALSLSDRVGVMNAGRLEQVGTPYDIYHQPATRFVANFVGKADFFPAVLQEGLVVAAIGSFAVEQQLAGVREIDLMVRPDDVVLAPENEGTGTIVAVKFLGGDAIYQVMLSDQTTLHSQRMSANLLPVGTQVEVKINLPHVVYFPR